MRPLNCSIRYLAILCLLASPGAYATSWSCMNNENIREVIIEYSESGSLPCKVIYNKPTEGFDKRVLWQADNKEGFCEEKANELVTRLESWGWKCYGEVADDEAASATEITSETEAVTGNESAPDAERELQTEKSPVSD